MIADTSSKVTMEKMNVLCIIICFERSVKMPFFHEGVNFLCLIRLNLSAWYDRVWEAFSTVTFRDISIGIKGEAVLGHCLKGKLVERN